ncbi:MAG: vitamin K epoxide reductase family protein [Gemmatimonadaceae bacterium]
MLIALVSLLGAFVALYLTLYKTGIIGQLACSVGSCETVNLSRWAVFLGLPVAAWGLGTYLLLLGLAVAGVQPALEHSRRLSLALLALSGWGVLFSAWLTYLELFVIRAICMWCVISAVLITVVFVLAWWDWSRARASVPAA